MKLSISTLMLSVALVFSTSVTKAVGDKTVKINTEKSKILWLGKKVTGQHNGSIKIQTGEIRINNDKIVGGKIYIDMKTIACEDIKDEKWNSKLVGHLNSEDFFGSEKHPTSSFEIVFVQPLEKAVEGMNVKITGNMMIKGIVRSISFPANVSINKGKVTGTGTAVLDRTEFDIKYGSGKFFEGLGDKAIYDDFTVTFDFTTL